MPYVTINQGIASSGGGGGGGDVTVSLTSGVQQQQFQALSGASSTTIPAGAYEVRVWNVGTDNITVNGAVVPPGEEWKNSVQYNYVTGRQDFVPDVTIVLPADAEASYQVLRPSL